MIGLELQKTQRFERLIAKIRNTTALECSIRCESLDWLALFLTIGIMYVSFFLKLTHTDDEFITFI